MEIINNRYRIDSILEKSHMVTVYEAADLHDSDKRIRLNLFNTEYISENLIDYYINEFVNIKNVFCSFIQKAFSFECVTMIDGKRTKDVQYFYTNELVESTKLISEVIQGQDLDYIIKVYAEVLKAVNYLHLKDYIYGEINLNNIYISSGEDHIKLKDIASVELEKYDYGYDKKRLTCFISPSVLAGEKANVRADIYSLGVLLFIMVFKVSPNKLDLKHEVKIQYKTFEGDFTERGIVYRDILKIIERMTYASVEQCYRSIGAVIDDINKTLGTNFKKHDLEEVKIISTDVKTIGREDEMKAVLFDYDQLAKHAIEKKLVSVHGELGCGKTKFMESIKYRLGLINADIYDSFSIDMNEGNRLFALADILEKIMSESDPETLEKYEGDISSIYPHYERNVHESIQNILNLSSNEKYRILSRISNFISDVIKDKPTVFMVDNIHLASEFSIQIVEYIYSVLSRKKNIMVIFSYCDGECAANRAFMEYLDKINAMSELRDIHLRGLNYEQTAQMIRTIFNLNTVPFKLSARIYAQSYGNPLFIYEIIKNLVVKKLIYINNETGRWQSDYDSRPDYGELPVPVNMEQALMHQVTGLDQESMDILSIVSIFSSPVTLEDIGRFTEYSQQELDDIISRLINNGVICRKIGDRGYAFDFYNRILKNVVYDNLSPAKKHYYHSAAADYLENQYFEYDPINFDELIYHLEKTKNTSKIVKYSLLNAKDMEAVKNTSDVIKNLQKAIDNLHGQEDIRARAELLIKLSNFQMKDGSIIYAIDSIKKAEKLVRQLKDHKLLLNIYFRLLDIFYDTCDVKSFDIYYKKMAELKNETESGSSEYIKIIAVEVMNMIRHEAYAEVYDKCHEGISLCEESNLYMKAYLYALGGKYFMCVSEPESAEYYYKKAAAMSSAGGYIEMYLAAMNSLGNLYNDFNQDFDAAEEEFSRMREISIRENFVYKELLALGNIGETAILKHDYIKAKECFREVLERSRSIESESDVFYSYIFLARISIYQCNIREAIEYLQLAGIDQKKHKSYTKLLDEYYITASEISYVLGDFDSALEYITKTFEFSKPEKSYSKLKLEMGYDFTRIMQEDDIKTIESLVDRLKLKIGLMKNQSSKFSAMYKLSIVLYTKRLSILSNSVFESIRRDAGETAGEEYKIEDISLRLIHSNSLVKHKLIPEAIQELGRSKKKQAVILVTKLIGDYYFKQKNYFNAINYYLESCEMIKDLIVQMPEEHRINFMNSHGMFEPFNSIKRIKTRYMNNVESNLTCDIGEVKTLDELENIISFSGFKEILSNKTFIKSMKKTYELNSNDSVKDIESLVSILTENTEQNINKILSYLSSITLATYGYVVTEDNDHNFEVIAAIGQNKSRQLNRHVIEKVKALGETVVITDPLYKNIEFRNFNQNIKACMCMPILSGEHKDGRNVPEKRRASSSRTRIKGYFYLETEKILNNFNEASTAKCMELNGLLSLILEKHQLKMTSSIDKLTGALSRKYLEEALTQNIEIAASQGNEFAIIMFDLDHFKNVNDRFGHQRGDEVLNKLCRVVMDNIRKEDILGRYGGEEFIIILPGTDKAGADFLAEKVRKKIEEEKILGDKMAVTISMGIAVYPEMGQHRHELVERADQALYIAKENGRNRSQVWEGRFSKKVKGTNKLTGIVSGNAVQDSRRVLVIVELIELLNKRKEKNEKIYKFLGRIIEIIEAEYGILFTIEDGKTVQEFSRKVFEEKWIKDVRYNQCALNLSIEKGQGSYFVDWDNILQYDKITGIPDWQSVIIVPVVRRDEMVGVLYFSVSTRQKEFSIEDFNFVSVLGEIIAGII